MWWFTSATAGKIGNLESPGDIGIGQEYTEMKNWLWNMERKGDKWDVDDHMVNDELRRPR